MNKRYEIFADYHQFYLRDAGRNADPPTVYSDGDILRRVKVEPFIVVIQPERDMIVPVEIEIAIEAPSDDLLDGWDHVVDASLDLPSGHLQICESTAGPKDLLSVQPGTYRVRAFFGGLGTLSSDGLGGEDHYRLVLWPAPSGPVQVLKQYGAAA